MLNFSIDLGKNRDVLDILWFPWRILTCISFSCPDYQSGSSLPGLRFFSENNPNCQEAFFMQLYPKCQSKPVEAYLIQVVASLTSATHHLGTCSCCEVCYKDLAKHVLCGHRYATMLNWEENLSRLFQARGKVSCWNTRIFWWGISGRIQIQLITTVKSRFYCITLHHAFSISA